MSVLFYILSGIGIISLIVFLRYVVIQKMRKSLSKNWKVGDKILICRNDETSSLINGLNKNNRDYAILYGFDSEKVYLTDGGITYELSWSSIHSNKSSRWRENYDSCQKYMKQNPLFSPDVKEENSSSGVSIDGNPIESMTETLCNVYLKKALDEENYEIAEAIRNRLKSFR